MSFKIGVIGTGKIAAAHVQQAIEKEMFWASWDAKTKPEQEDLLSVAQADVVLICIPPNFDPKTWKQTFADIHQALTKLDALSYTGVVVIRSNLLPGSTEKLASIFGSLRLLHSPAFVSPWVQSDCYNLEDQEILLSGPDRAVDYVTEVFEALFPGTSILCVESYRVSELAPYVHEAFLGIKLSFFNEMHQLCEKVGVKYRDLLEILSAQQEIGWGYTEVPAPDGEAGWSAQAVTENTAAFLEWADVGMSVHPHTLGGAVMTNRYIRPDFYRALLEEHQKEQAEKQAQSAATLARAIEEAKARGLIPAEAQP